MVRLDTEGPLPEKCPPPSAKSRRRAERPQGPGKVKPASSQPQSLQSATTTTSSIGQIQEPTQSSAGSGMDDHGRQEQSGWTYNDNVFQLDAQRLASSRKPSTPPPDKSQRRTANRQQDSGKAKEVNPGYTPVPSHSTVHKPRNDRQVHAIPGLIRI
ncbi:hypothetical protein FOMPIDRAFT_1056651 [Fomitopsis schrenkii]|nr:hypothetical protein FOMPIDRAFT_1056651 [Fomitopsis schrenkii]